MKIYIKTPLYKNSTYISHLLEHCFLNQRNFSDYMNYTFEIYWYTDFWYIKFEWIDKKFVNSYVKMLFEFPHTNQIDYEKNMINTEYDNLSIWDKLYDLVWKKILWNDFSAYESKKISINEIKQYHQNVFTPKNVFITNDNDKLLTNDIFGYFNNYSLNKIKYLDDFVIDNNKYKVIFLKYTSPFEYIIMDFLNNMLYPQIEYYQRFINKKYYFDLTWLMKYPWYLAISIPYEFKFDKIIFDFNLYKKLYLSRVFSSNKYFYQLINILLLDNNINTMSYKWFIEQLNYDLFLIIENL